MMMEISSPTKSVHHIEDPLMAKLVVGDSAPFSFPVSKVPLPNGVIPASSVTNGSVSNGVVVITNGHSVTTSSSSSSVASDAASASAAAANSNTKAQFYDMMAKLLRSQLENCDPQTPVSALLATAPGSVEAEATNSGSASGFPRLRDSQNRPYMLQPSLFPLQYPTVFFAAEDDYRKMQLCLWALDNVPD